MLLFHCGLDHFVIPSNGSVLKWDGGVAVCASSSYEVAPGFGRASISDANTGGLKVTGGNGFGGGTLPAAYLYKNLNKNVTEGVVGFAILMPNLGAQDVVICALQDGANTQVDLRLSTSGQFYFTKNGIALGPPSASMLPSNQVRYAELKTKIDGAIGTVELRIAANAGAPWLKLTGLNTKATGNAYFNRVILGEMSTTTQNGVVGPTLYFDDVYMLDTTGPDCNDFLGDVRVNGQVANADGSVNDWQRSFAAWAPATVMALGQQIQDSNGNVQMVVGITGDAKTGAGPAAPAWGANANDVTVDNHATWKNRGPAANFKAVSELPTPDGDSSYLYSDVVGQRASFRFAPIVGSKVFARTLWPFAGKDDAGARAVRVEVESGGVVADNGQDLSMSTTKGYQPAIFQHDPQTGAAWTVAAVNASEARIKTAQ